MADLVIPDSEDERDSAKKQAAEADAAEQARQLEICEAQRKSEALRNKLGAIDEQRRLRDEQLEQDVMRTRRAEDEAVERKKKTLEEARRKALEEARKQKAEQQNGGIAAPVPPHPPEPQTESAQANPNVSMESKDDDEDRAWKAKEEEIRRKARESELKWKAKEESEAQAAKEAAKRKAEEDRLETKRQEALARKRRILENERREIQMATRRAEKQALEKTRERAAAEREAVRAPPPMDADYQAAAASQAPPLLAAASLTPSQIPPPLVSAPLAQPVRPLTAEDVNRKRAALGRMEVELDQKRRRCAGKKAVAEAKKSDARSSAREAKKVGSSETEERKERAATVFSSVLKQFRDSKTDCESYQAKVDACRTELSTLEEALAARPV